MKTLIWVISGLSAFTGLAQADNITVQQAVELALKNNQSIKAAAFETEAQKKLIGASFDLPKTNVSLMYGQYNGYPKNDNNFSVSQTIPFVALGSQRALNKSLAASSESKKSAIENELVYQVRQVYFQVAFALAMNKLLLQQDSIYEGFLKSASFRYKTGESTLLEQTTAETQRNEAKNQVRQNEADIIVYRTQLKTLLGSGALPQIAAGSFQTLIFLQQMDTAAVFANPSVEYMRHQVEVSKNQKLVEAAKFAPDLNVGFFSQTLIDVQDLETGAIAGKDNRFSGFQIGLAIPLWLGPHQSRLKAAELNRQASLSHYQYYRSSIQGQFQQAIQQYAKNKNSLDYYQTSALANAELMLKQSRLAFQSGEIGYAEYLLSVKNAIAIKDGYLHTLNDYNQSIIHIEFLAGNK